MPFCKNVLRRANASGSEYVHDHKPLYVVVMFIFRCFKVDAIVHFFSLETIVHLIQNIVPEGNDQTHGAWDDTAPDTNVHL